MRKIRIALAAKVDVQHERAEGNYRGEQRPEGSLERPLSHYRDLGYSRNKQHKEDAVQPSDVADGLLYAGKVLQRHRDPQKKEVGNALK